MTKEILGILGGMGPYAALEFHKKILDYDEALKDWEHTHILLDNNVNIPSRTRHILYGEEDPTKYIIKSINNLAKLGAKAVVLPCNSVHYFYDRVIENINIPWLNMLEIVAEEIKSQNLKRTLIIGGYITVNKKTYDKYLNDTYYLNEKENEVAYALIEAVKINDLGLANKLAEELINYFDFYAEKYSIDSILLACTEFAISVTLQEYNNIRLFDSNDIYAKYSSRYMRG